LEGSQASVICHSGKSNMQMMSMKHCWNVIDRGNLNTQTKPCPRAPLSTTNLTCTDLVSNLGICGEFPAKVTSILRIYRFIL